MLRSVDGGGEVDLDKRAITGEDDIIELDQLHPQDTEPPAAPIDCDPQRGEPAKSPGPTTGATPTTSAGEAGPPRRIVVLGDETDTEDPHSNRSITAAPDHPTLPPAAPLPGTPARPLPATEATSGSPAHASRSRRDPPRLLTAPRTTLRTRPRLATGVAILMLALTAAAATSLAPGGRDHGAHNPRTTASAGTTNSAPTSPTIRHVAVNAARQPAQARRTVNRRRSHPRRHHRSVAASAPATVAATQESGASHSQASSYTAASAVHSQTPPSERPPTSSSPPAPTHQQSSSTSRGSTQPSKAALKSLVTGAGTCSCQ